jgi:hypothetical protein
MHWPSWATVPSPQMRSATHTPSTSDAPAPQLTAGPQPGAVSMASAVSAAAPSHASPRAVFMGRIWPP